MAMTYLYFLQICLPDMICPCSEKTIIWVDNIFKLFYYHWNVFYYFLFWSKHIYNYIFLTGDRSDLYFIHKISCEWPSVLATIIWEGYPAYMMVVSTDQWRAEIGSFNCHSLYLLKCKWDDNHVFLKIIVIYFLPMCKILNSKFYLSKFAAKLMFQWKAILILSLLCLCSLPLPHGDIELNPGPRNRKNHLPSFCRWNFDSLPVHNFAKMLLFKSINCCI